MSSCVRAGLLSIKRHELPRATLPSRRFGGRTADPLSPDPAHDAGAGALQLVDVSAALAAARDSPEPAGAHPAAVVALRGALRVGAGFRPPVLPETDDRDSASPTGQK